MKSCRRLFTLAWASLFLLFLTSIPALAAEGAEPDPADSTAGLIFRWLNFLLVFGGIGYLIAKNGGSFFRGNAQAIAASIHEGTAAKEEAQRQLREVDAKIAHLDREVDELREAARRDSTIEAERLNASGLAEIEKIRMAARVELAAAERAAQHELREIASSMAVQRAGELLNSRMNVETRAKLFRSFLDDLGRRPN